MKFTPAMIENPQVFFKFKKPTQYWRHLVKGYDEENNLWVDFVKNPKNRGTKYRVNIRLIPKAHNAWQSNGWPVRYPDSSPKNVSSCWVNESGLLEEIDESKDNRYMKDRPPIQPYEPFMQALYEKLGGSGPLGPNNTEVIE